MEWCIIRVLGPNLISILCFGNLSYHMMVLVVQKEIMPSQASNFYDGKLLTWRRLGIL